MVKQVLTKESILDLIKEHNKEIKRLGVKRLILFGSYASDSQKKESDIDFLVEFEKNRGLFDDYTGLLHLFEEIFNKNIDLVKTNLIREELRPYIMEGKKYEARI